MVTVPVIKSQRLALMLHEDNKKLQLELKDCLIRVQCDMSRLKKKKSAPRARVQESVEQVVETSTSLPSRKPPPVPQSIRDACHDCPYRALPPPERKVEFIQLTELTPHVYKEELSVNLTPSQAHNIARRQIYFCSGHARYRHTASQVREMMAKFRSSDAPPLFGILKRAPTNGAAANFLNPGFCKDHNLAKPPLLHSSLSSPSQLVCLRGHTGPTLYPGEEVNIKNRD
jgi:hypothetical protein